jgi:hypothetical protein
MVLSNSPVPIQKQAYRKCIRTDPVKGGDREERVLYCTWYLCCA